MRAFVACGLLLASACTFPDVEIGSGGASSTSTSTKSSASTSSSSLSSSSASSSSSSSASASSSSTGIDPCQTCLSSSQCDCDNDTVPRYDPAHGCMGVMNDPTKSDCNDCRMDVHPGQTGYFTTAVEGTDFDYDCSGKNDPKYVQGSCTNTSIASGCSKDFAQSTVACGMTVVVDHCANPGLGLTCTTNSSDTIPMMPCR